MYINFMSQENKYIYISRWLLLITFLVGLMIIVGGLTRLTDSGLSITRWDLISGIIPPLTLEAWEKSFTLYKQIPEYKLQNSSMNLDQFKIIFWWEYIHRLLGRLIGVLYFFPLIYFLTKKYINKKHQLQLYIILFAILLQGFLGWYMVMSGLTENTNVSHYRLSLHLTLAFIIFIMLLWNYLKFTNNPTFLRKEYFPKYILTTFLILILLQISVGALVSGLDAGQIYQTWPLMNQYYFPDDSKINELFSLKSFEIPSLVQFMHRNLAYLIFSLFLIILLIIFKNKNYNYLKKTAFYVFVFLFLQVFLGILAILSGAQIIVASAHQVCSIFLVTFSLILIFKNSKIN